MPAPPHSPRGVFCYGSVKNDQLFFYDFNDGSQSKANLVDKRLYADPKTLLECHHRKIGKRFHVVDIMRRLTALKVALDSPRAPSHFMYVFALCFFAFASSFIKHLRAVSGTPARTT